MGVREGTSGSYRAGRLHGGTLAKLEHLVQGRPGQRTFLCRYTAGEVGETWGETWALKANNDYYYYSVLNTGLC